LSNRNSSDAGSDGSKIIINLADFDSIEDSVIEGQPEPKVEVDQTNLAPSEHDYDEQSNTRFKFGSYNDQDKEPSEESDGRVIINIDMDDLDDSNEASNNGMNDLNITHFLLLVLINIKQDNEEVKSDSQNERIREFYLKLSFLIF
jgi:hypothetical protein